MPQAKETRSFKMHAKLLMDVIKRQAGSLSKAILEGIQNSIDAGATHCLISLDQTSLLIKDDGRGFQNRDNIVKWFEVFGLPHEENEGKVFGTFRIGRGQLFAFGANEWKTGAFRMVVDVDKRGLDYDLLEGQKNVPGCVVRVQLYQKLTLSDLMDCQRDIQKWCKWAPIKVYFNDEQVNCDPTTAKWDHVLPEAYVKLRETGTLSVYNLGIHVCELPGHRFGCGGEVVSRQQLRVNFARNDIQSDCPVWKKIKPFIDEQATDRNTEKKSLDDDSRQRLADQLISGKLTAGQAEKLKLFTAVTGRHYTAREAGRYYGFKFYSSAPRGNRLGDVLMKRRVAFIFADETLARFQCKDVQSLVQWMKQKFAYFSRDFELPCTSFADLTAGLDESCSLLEEKELSDKEKMWLSIMHSIGADIIVDDQRPYGWGEQCRRLCLGVSQHANGWTDGASYVAIARSYLQERDLDLKGIADVVGLLIHEACHDSPDMVDHDHDQAFYEKFHDAVRLCMGRCVDRGMQAVINNAKRITRKAVKSVDKIQQAADSLQQSNQAVAASSK